MKYALLSFILIIPGISWCMQPKQKYHELAQMFIRQPEEERSFSKHDVIDFKKMSLADRIEFAHKHVCGKIIEKEIVAAALEKQDIDREWIEKQDVLTLVTIHKKREKIFRILGKNNIEIKDTLGFVLNSKLCVGTLAFKTIGRDSKEAMMLLGTSPSRYEREGEKWVEKTKQPPVVPGLAKIPSITEENDQKSPERKENMKATVDEIDFLKQVDAAMKKISEDENVAQREKTSLAQQLQEYEQKQKQFGDMAKKSKIDSMKQYTEQQAQRYKKLLIEDKEKIAKADKALKMAEEEKLNLDEKTEEISKDFIEKIDRRTKRLQRLEESIGMIQKTCQEIEQKERELAANKKMLQQQAQKFTDEKITLQKKLEMMKSGKKLVAEQRVRKAVSRNSSGDISKSPTSHNL
jgi:DNA repair exonuclease SbcCD ATPase subunit